MLDGCTHGSHPTAAVAGTDAGGAASDNSTESAGTGTGAPKACGGTPKQSSVHGLFALNCLGETFGTRATLSQVRQAADAPNEVENASFDLLDQISPSVACSLPQTISYRGTVPPGLQIGATFRLRAWFNESDAQHASAIVTLRNDAGDLLLAWYYQSTEHLDVPFAPELGIALASASGCRSETDSCFALVTYNSLVITHDGLRRVLNVGEELELHSGEVIYRLGLNGGTLREKASSPPCLDDLPGSDTIFALVRQ